MTSGDGPTRGSLDQSPEMPGKTPTGGFTYGELSLDVGAVTDVGSVRGGTYLLVLGGGLGVPEDRLVFPEVVGGLELDG